MSSDKYRRSYRTSTSSEGNFISNQYVGQGLCVLCVVSYRVSDSSRSTPAGEKSQVET